VEASEELGNKVILANDRVRIWEHRVGPGATGHLHLHRRPYFSVVVRGGTGETVGPDGTVLQSFDLAPGSVLWYGDDEVPETHAFRNTDQEEIVIVTTEIM